LASSFLQRSEPFLARIILSFLKRLTLDFELRDAAFELFQFLRHGLHLRAELGGGLVHEVNRLVRQKRSEMYRCESCAAPTSAASWMRTL